MKIGQATHLFIIINRFYPVVFKTHFEYSCSKRMSELYIWGKPIVTQFSSNRANPSTVFKTDSRIYSVSSGENHCVVLGEDGVFAMGDNSEGQLGLDHCRNSGPNLKKVELRVKTGIVDVSCGWYHTLLLGENGDVYSSGRGDNGELGRGKVRSS